MFASSLPRPGAHGFANAYRSVGIETGVHAATPHALVAMLFDGCMDAIAEARGALRASEIEAKGRAIGRAVRIVHEGLSAGLNLDDGGPLAVQLRELYAYVCMRLTQANLRNDDAALAECQRLVEPLRDAWKAIAPAVDSRKAA